MSRSKIEFYGWIPCFAKHICMWGEAGTVKRSKYGKVKACGAICIFIGNATDHEGDCCHMWNPVAGIVPPTDVFQDAEHGGKKAAIGSLHFRLYHKSFGAAR